MSRRGKRKYKNERCLPFFDVRAKIGEMFQKMLSMLLLLESDLETAKYVCWVLCTSSSSGCNIKASRVIWESELNVTLK